MRAFSDSERIIIEELIRGYKKDNYGGYSQAFIYTTDE